MKQPYTYSMPEEFLHDQAVPARWRVWGILNGFFLNRKACWASNEWIGEKIGAHKDTVSQAVKELEDLGVIKCTRTRRKRVINISIPNSEIGTDTYLRPKPVPISDRHQHLSNSDSNSDNRKGENKFSISSEEIIEVVDEKKPRAKKDSLVMKLREKLYDTFEQSKGVRPIPHLADYITLQTALKHLTREQVETLVEDELAAGNPITVRECLTNRKITKFLQENY